MIPKPHTSDRKPTQNVRRSERTSKRCAECRCMAILRQWYVQQGCQRPFEVDPDTKWLRLVSVVIEPNPCCVPPGLWNVEVSMTRGVVFLWGSSHRIPFALATHAPLCRDARACDCPVPSSIIRRRPCVIATVETATQPSCQRDR